MSKLITPRGWNSATRPQKVNAAPTAQATQVNAGIDMSPEVINAGKCPDCGMPMRDVDILADHKVYAGMTCGQCRVTLNKPD